MRSLRLVTLVTCFAVLLVARSAEARPPGPGTFCDTYPEAPECGSSDVDCAFCHNGGPPALNVFGASVSAELLPGTPRPLTNTAFAAGLPAALRAVEDADADGDGFSNYEEIIEGTAPGNSESKPAGNDCPENAFYNLCDYDHNFTYKRVSLDFCGQSPTFDEMEAFRAMSLAEKETALDTKLAGCLDSAFWQGQDGVLWSLANRKVRPVQTLKAGEGPGSVAIADYDHDYNLFVYSQLDNNDARDAMTAQYFVKREGPTSLRPLTFEEEATEFVGGAIENVDVPFRAGLLTSRWTLLYFEMFAILPRAAAAQASRAFLREDWARMEGLVPVDVPIDFDNAGVDAPLCAVCHTTIDPAAEAWKNYAGFVGTGGQGRAAFVPDRMNLFEAGFPGISGMGTGWFKGQPVTDLPDWADKAANSDAFASATVMDYWQITVSGEPTGMSEIDEFDALWQDFMTTDNYRVEPMLFKLIRTRAYGEP